MDSYSLQYLRQIDKIIRHRSNNILCTRFRKDLDFDLLWCPNLSFVWAWYMQKLAATNKNFDKDTTAAFVSHMPDLFLQKTKIKWKTLLIV